MRFNPYKAQRQLDRRSRAWHRTAAWFRTLLPSGPQPGRYANPLHRQAKKRWPLPVFILILLTVGGILVWHPFFTVHLVGVTGVTRVPASEVSEAAQGIMDRTRWLILPGSNYFLIDTTEIANILTQRFPFYSVKLVKRFPSQLDIQVAEKEPVLIFDNGQEYSYIDPSGQVIKVLERVGDNEWQFKTTAPAAAATSTPNATTTLEIVSRWHEPAAKRIATTYGLYPILYQVGGATTTPNSQAVSFEMVTNVLAWQKRLDNSLGQPGALFFVQDNERGEGSIRTRAGWYIKVRLLDDVETQVSRLELVLRTLESQKVKPNYIDVRFEGKVFWQ